MKKNPSNAKIVIVEDDQKLADLIEGQLKRFGYDAYQITDLEQIDQEIMQINPLLVILDINLPT